MIFTIMNQYYNLFCQLQQYSTLNQFICFLMSDFSEFDSGLTFSFKYTYMYIQYICTPTIYIHIYIYSLYYIYIYTLHTCPYTKYAKKCHLHML